MRGLKKLTETSLRVIKNNKIGFIYNLDAETQDKLLAEIKKYGAIAIDCSMRRTKGEFYSELENEFNLPHNTTMDRRLENLIEEFRKGNKTLVVFNAEGLGSLDYKMLEDFNDEGASVILLSASPRYYQKMLETRTYRNRAIMEHDFAELN